MADDNRPPSKPDGVFLAENQSASQTTKAVMVAKQAYAEAKTPPPPQKPKN